MRGLYNEHGKPLPLRSQEEAARDIARKTATRLTNETAGYLISPAAIERQKALSLSDVQAARSLAVFMQSPLGRKSMEKE